MSLRRLLVIVGAILAVWWFFNRNGPVEPPPSGVRIHETPLQFPDAATPWPAKDWEIAPLARYSIKARVLSKHRYRFDFTAPIAPWDLALGWGPMSDSGVLEFVAVSQGGRWFDYYYKPGIPVSAADVAVSSANVHCLPASEFVMGDLDRLRVNQFVQLQGWLIEARRENAPPWRSSLVRNDTGDGACEILWVTSVVVLDR